MRKNINIVEKIWIIKFIDTFRTIITYKNWNLRVEFYNIGLRSNFANILHYFTCDDIIQEVIILS